MSKKQKKYSSEFKIRVIMDIPVYFALFSFLSSIHGLLVLLLALTLTLIACNDNTVEEGLSDTDAPSADESSTEALGDDNPNKSVSNTDGTVDLPFIPF